MTWDDEAENWDDNPAVKAYAVAAFRSLQGLLDNVGTSLKDARVLDFGCGTGLLTSAVAEHADQVVGLDLSEAMVAKLRAKKLPKVRALCGELVDYDLGPFDVIICSSVCAFLPDYPAAAAQLAALLAPGGVFVQWDWELDPQADEPFGLAKSDIRQALVAAGLVDVAVQVGFEIPFGDDTMAPLLGTGRRPAVAESS